MGVGLLFEVCTTMLDKNDQELLNAEAYGIASALGLAGWKIDITWTSLPDRDMGNCSPDPGQRWAEIEIDPEKHDTPEEARITLRHELIHCFAAQFETYRKAVRQLVREDDMNVLDMVFSMAAESLVSHVQIALDRKA